MGEFSEIIIRKCPFKRDHVTFYCFHSRWFIVKLQMVIFLSYFFFLFFLICEKILFREATLECIKTMQQKYINRVFWKSGYINRVFWKSGYINRVFWKSGYINRVFWKSGYINRVFLKYQYITRRGGGMDI